MSLLKNRIINIFWVTAEKFGLVILSVISFFIYAKLLTPEQIGLGILLLAGVEFCSMFIIAAIESSLIKFKSVSEHQDGTVFWSVLFLSFFLSALIYSCYWLYFDDNSTKLIALLAVLALPFLLGGRVHIVHMRKQKQFKKLAHRTIVGKLVGMGAGIGLAVYGAGSYAIVVQTLVMAITSLVLIMAFERRYLPLTFDKNFLVEMSKLGIPASLKIMNNNLFMKGIVIVIEVKLGTVAVGFYNFANRLIELPRSAILSTILSYANPVFSDRKNRGLELEDFYIKSTKIGLLVIFPFFIGLNLVCDTLVHLLFGNKWSNSIPLLKGLAVVTTFSLLFMALPSALIANGKTKLGLKGHMASSVIALVATIISIPYFGLMGVLFGAATRTVIISIVNYVTMLKVLEVTFKNWFSAIFPSMFAAMIMWCVTEFTHSIFNLGDDFIALSITILVAFVVYVISVITLDREIVSEIKLFLSKG
ncbi:oligosaccharide flippase family protein [Alteromonas macleodii]|uniref:oligosaccharide flippase family protein n=1 Tax=Alteromonas macleodii TaxID=28108 RepID=UPI0036669048|tara:strand:- start:23012 stop:24439 length:1428 start_codon:yes stop_codon:yes gene_type:complete